MPFYLVTMKNPGRTPKYHEKELGACRMSPTCTDAEGAHHTFLAEAPNMEIILAQGLKEEMHITRIEEVYHIRKYEGADVSVRDDADQRVPSTPGTITNFDLNAVPGIQSIPRIVDARDIAIWGDPNIRARVDSDIDAELNTLGYDGSRGYGQVSGTSGEGQEVGNLQRETPEGDYRIGPDGDGVIRN